MRKGYISIYAYDLHTVCTRDQQMAARGQIVYKDPQTRKEKNDDIIKCDIKIVIFSFMDSSFSFLPLLKLFIVKL